MTEPAAGGGMILARTPDGRDVSVPEKQAHTYVERGFVITDEAAAKRVAAAMRRGARPAGAPELAPGQVHATSPDGRRVAINLKLRADYEARGFRFEGSVEREAPALRDPEPARTTTDTNSRVTSIPGEVAMLDPDGRPVNISAKFAGTYLDRGYTMGEQPERVDESTADGDVFPDPMGPGLAPPNAGGEHTGTSY